jgi:hypothetical protein
MRQRRVQKIRGPEHMGAVFSDESSQEEKPQVEQDLDQEEILAETPAVTGPRRRRRQTQHRSRAARRKTIRAGRNHSTQ